ncbi:PaaI family thioesterase [Faunimonas sp. B44]|uniref:PaaI family thioesterase n=1 Tax=Faunimonas sp. B44 TaxID=3461493 RepID=UPI004044F24F
MSSARTSREDIQKQLDASPFIAFMQLTCTEMDAEAGTITMTMPMRPELERGAGTGQFHGGPIASLIDTVGDFAVVMAAGGNVPTINFRVDYLRPAFGKTLVGKALIRRVGRTIAVIDIDVFDEGGKLTAVGRGCYGVSSS